MPLLNFITGEEIEEPCPQCHGLGGVRIHEDYGISFEYEECEACEGTGLAS